MSILLVAASRVVLAVRYLVDAVAGIALGLGAVYGVFWPTQPSGPSRRRRSRSWPR